jgi:hypothetical protein
MVAEGQRGEKQVEAGGVSGTGRFTLRSRQTATLEAWIT